LKKKREPRKQQMRKPVLLLIKELRIKKNMKLNLRPKE
jgi:hypothetical protein